MANCHHIRPSQQNPGKWLIDRRMGCPHTQEQIVAEYTGPLPAVDPHTDLTDTLARLMGALRDDPELLAQVKELLTRWDSNS